MSFKTGPAEDQGPADAENASSNGPEHQRSDNAPGADARSLASLLNSIEHELERRTVMGAAERVAVTLWIAHSYVFDRFQITPRLFITSVGPDSGKSIVLRIVAELSDGGRYVTDASVSALARVKQPSIPTTVALDQLDNAFDGRDAGKRIDALCAGADRNAQRLTSEEVRVKGGVKRWDVEAQETFYPIALGKIGGLPKPALRSRTIVVHMYPATREEYLELRPVQQQPVKPALRERLEEVFAALADAIGRRLPDLPEGFFNRKADKWTPLLAVAEEAGGDWPERARAAAEELEADDEGEPAHITFLRKVVIALEGWPHEVIFSAELDDAVKREFGSTVSAKKRGELLRAVGLKTREERRDGRKLKAYRLSELREAAARCLPADG